MWSHGERKFFTSQVWIERGWSGASQRGGIKGVRRGGRWEREIGVAQVGTRGRRREEAEMGSITKEEKGGKGKYRRRGTLVWRI